MNKIIRFNDSEKLFRCPICKRKLKMVGNSLLCSNKHCFDISKLGYVNFALNQKQSKHYSRTSFKPKKYAERVNHIFEVLGLSLFECYDMTEKLYKEVKKIATEINNFLNEGNSDERKQI